MNDDSRDFQQFLEQRQAAARAYVNGDAGPVLALLTRTDPSTFFGPGGGHEQGAEQVSATHDSGAKQFEAGSENRLEILQSGASGGVGFWTGLQRATVRLRGKPEPVPMTLRVTEVFRREGGEWKLVHRHADMLAEKSPKQ